MTLKSEEKKRRIIDAGVALFARHGIAGTRLADIASRARLAKATLYYYFPDGKETIFSRAVRSVVSEIFDGLRAEVMQHDSSSERLRVYVYERVAIFDRELTSRGVVPEVWDELKPLAQRVLEPYFAEEKAMVRDIIAAGVADGSFRTVEPEVAAHMLTATLRGITADGPIDITPAQRKRQLDTIFGLFTSGLVAADA